MITTDGNSELTPDCSPGGSYITYFSNVSGNEDIWVIPSSGGTPSQITVSGTEDSYPAWSPDSTKIAYSSLTSGNFDIWIANALPVSIKSASLGEIKATFK